jgi:uncharacterized membrane protein
MKPLIPEVEMQQLAQRLKRYLITGLLVWVPLGITLWVLDLTITTMDQTLLLLPDGWHPDRVLGHHIPGLGIILTLAVVGVTGLLMRNVFGQRLWEQSEKAMLRVPFMGSIYKGVKQVSDTLLSGNGNSFRHVLLVRYPHPEAWSLAFQTSVPGEVEDQLADEHVAVFIPTTPSPVNGFYFFVRKADTIALDMSVDVALRAIVSMGVVAAADHAKHHAALP